MGLSICLSVSIQIKSVSRLGFIFWSDRLPLLLRKEGWIKLFWANMSIVVFISQLEFFFCAVGCQHRLLQAYPTIPIEIKGEKVMHCRALMHLAVEFSVGLRDGCSQRSFHSSSAWAPLSMAIILWWLTNPSFNLLTPSYSVYFILSLAVATIFYVTVASKKVASTTRVLSGIFATAAGWWIYK